VNVVDTTAPSMSLIGAATMTVECHATFSDPGATASDVCAGNLTAQIQRTGSVNTDVVGAYSLIYVVGDAAGNNTWLFRTVNVVDTTAPALVVPSALTVFTGPVATTCGAVVSDAALGSASAQDACAGSRPVTRTGVPSGNVFPVGKTTITYTAADPSGNTVTRTQDVTVVDNTPPVAVWPNIVRTTDPGVCNARVNFAPTVFDNCPGVTYSTSVASGSVFPIGTTTVTWTARDAALNSVSGSFTVTVSNPAPTVGLSPPASGWVFATGTSASLSG